MTRKPTICATFLEKLAIKAMLDERLHPVDGTELFRYEEGWNDGVTAHYINPTLSGNITAKIRNECFGKLHGKTPMKRVKLEERVRLLESQLKLTLDWMQSFAVLTQAERDIIEDKTE